MIKQRLTHQAKWRRGKREEMREDELAGTGKGPSKMTHSPTIWEDLTRRRRKQKWSNAKCERGKRWLKFKRLRHQFQDKDKMSSRKQCQAAKKSLLVKKKEVLTILLNIPANQMILPRRTSSWTIKSSSDSQPMSETLSSFRTANKSILSFIISLRA